MEPIDGPLRLIDERSIEAPAAADSAAPTEPPRRTSVEDLVYQRELWSKRATAARECGEELGKLARALARVVERNYFGITCVEGQAVYDGLLSMVDLGVSSFERIGDDAVSLFGAASAALRDLEAADDNGKSLVGG